jgi:peptidoglycan L-alanyl-D-glutamate endopeptidase CwlK
MPYLSRTSRERLLTVDDRLMRVCLELITYFDYTVVCGHRSPEEQARLYAQGRTAPGDIVTWTLNSFHNHSPSLAVDLCPWKPGVGLDWHNRNEFYKMAGAFLYIASLYDYPVTWGGDWPTRKRDLPHMQIEPYPSL